MGEEGDEGVAGRGGEEELGHAEVRSFCGGGGGGEDGFVDGEGETADGLCERVHGDVVLEKVLCEVVLLE